jgi:hypothetical protein
MAAVAGVRIYAAFATPDRLICVANEFNFGCYTPLGWAISLGVAVLLVVAIYAWERFRGS